ncbi:MAG: tRNA pseudouridine(55) synthase TruB [Peptoniphilaceae bacterium]|nr:tRNA pseudouridine(55) synthase TruB [Peptoniphilaceae bacterium]MDY6085540.1 tRNA pseudouridine(55) synthase TruB [Peptoniphilaceae bacterium]
MGILNVNKGEGMTSHDVVALVRRATGERRVGHGGTLDPMATGVLPVFIGRATRLAEYQSDREKEYVFTMTFGRMTDTLDRTGTTIETGTDTVDESAFCAAVSSFVGSSMQTPPMYSAVKVNGKKLYEYARKGQTVEREARPITIYEMEILSFDGHEATVRCRCSKGTYVRQLIADLAAQLGTCAIMTALVRTAVGALRLDEALSIDAIQKGEHSALEAHLLPPDRAVSDYPAIHFNRDEGRRLLQGQRVRTTETSLPGELFRFYAAKRFLGMGTCETAGWHIQKAIAEMGDL